MSFTDLFLVNTVIILLEYDRAECIDNVPCLKREIYTYHVSFLRLRSLYYIKLFEENFILRNYKVVVENLSKLTSTFNYEIKCLKMYLYNNMHENQ